MTEYSKKWGVRVEDLYEVIRSKRVQVKRSIDNFVQVFIGPHVWGAVCIKIVHQFGMQHIG